MGVFVLTNALVKVNGVDLSDHASQVTVSTNYRTIETTPVGSAFATYAKSVVGGTTIGLTLYQDFAAGKTHSTLQSLVGSNIPVAVEVRPVNGAVSSTNPAVVIQAFLNSYSVLDARVGGVSTVSAIFVEVPQTISDTGSLGVSPGGSYTKAGSGRSDLNAAGAKALTDVNTGSGVSDLNASGTHLPPFTTTFIPIGSRVLGGGWSVGSVNPLVKSGRGVSDFNASGSNNLSLNETGAATSDLNASGYRASVSRVYPLGAIVLGGARI